MKTLLLMLLIGCGDDPPLAPPGPPPKRSERPLPQRPVEDLAPPDEKADEDTEEPRPGDATPEVQQQCEAAIAEILGGNPGKPIKTRLDAGELNTAGFRCYRADRMDAALPLFEAAIRADDRHALGHYNLAATLGVLRNRGVTCENDVTLERMLHHLKKAIELDPDRLERMKTDPDLELLRETAGYHMLAGASPGRRDKALLKLFMEASFYSLPQGAYGNLERLDLRGQEAPLALGPEALPALVRRRVVDDDGSVDELTTEGTWALTEDAVLLFDPDAGEPGPEVQRLRLDPEGNLVPADGGGPLWLGLPSECSA